MLLALVGLAAAIGVTLLWDLDLRVYHQLLDACFVEGLRLEAKHAWLPRIRTNMLRTQRAAKYGVLAHVVWFYVVGTIVCLFLTVVGSVLAVQSLLDAPLAVVAAVALVAVTLAALWAIAMIRGTDSPLLSKWVKGARAAAKNQ